MCGQGKGEFMTLCFVVFRIGRPDIGAESPGCHQRRGESQTATADSGSGETEADWVRGLAG